MEEIMQAVAVLQAGDRQSGRQLLLKLWDQWSGTNATLERCTIAHFLADTEKEPAAELEWDLRALEVATGTRGLEDREAVDPALKTFLPSLHLNVGDAYRRLGEPDRAKRHADIGLGHPRSLTSDPYGRTVHEALQRLLRRLDSEA